MTVIPFPARETDPQRVAADPELSAFVTANAGSGKTKTLIDRVARLLLAGAAPETILCVTYTKAAAAEMQRRLFDRLGQWSVCHNHTRLSVSFSSARVLQATPFRLLSRKSKLSRPTSSALTGGRPGFGDVARMGRSVTLTPSKLSPRPVIVWRLRSK